MCVCVCVGGGHKYIQVYIVYKVPKATAAPMQQDTVWAFLFPSRQWTNAGGLTRCNKKLHSTRNTSGIKNKHALTVGLFSEAHIRLRDSVEKDEDT